MSRMPALFVGHGSPMNAIEDNPWSESWRALGERLPRPNAILCISAHWQTEGVFVGAAERPQTIHDFGGFPDALYAMQYPAPGDPALAERVRAMLDPALQPQLDAAYGLDHGAWQVLHRMYPQADIPVVQLSLDLRRPGPHHYMIGRMLAPLRDEGVLILGSGNIVHNLRRLRMGEPPADWALRFRDLVNALMMEGRHRELAELYALPDAKLAAPTPEHYFPLLHVLATAQLGESIELLTDDVISTISMTSVLIGGLPPKDVEAAGA